VTVSGNLEKPSGRLNAEVIVVGKALATPPR